MTTLSMAMSVARCVECYVESHGMNSIIELPWLAIHFQLFFTELYLALLNEDSRRHRHGKASLSARALLNTQSLHSSALSCASCAFVLRVCFDFQCAHMVNGGSGPWTCPSTCMRTRHGLSPFCVQTSHEGAPCRAASRKQVFKIQE